MPRSHCAGRATRRTHPSLHMSNVRKMESLYFTHSPATISRCGCTCDVIACGGSRERRNNLQREFSTPDRFESERETDGRLSVTTPRLMLLRVCWHCWRASCVVTDGAAGLMESPAACRGTRSETSPHGVCPPRRVSPPTGRGALWTLRLVVADHK